jgi:transcriptional regulator GlxA family with amidase domain
LGNRITSLERLGCGNWACEPRIDRRITCELCATRPRVHDAISRVTSGAIRQLASAAPSTFSHPEVIRSLEQELMKATMRCLAGQEQTETRSRRHYHSAIVKKFEDLLAANCNKPLYLAELCQAVGASERTLRICCEEHLGMGPTRYLWHRRMQLARCALTLADPAITTVTQVAVSYGFWELGRFAVSYRSLFGESPSTSLRRPAGSATVG